MELKNKIILQIKSFFKNNIIYIIGILLLLYKSLLLNELLIGVRMDKIMAMIPITMLIMLPTLSSKNKFNIKYLNIVYGILTLVIYSNFLYYKFSTTFLSVYQLSNIQYTSEITLGLSVLIDLKMFCIFWIDNMLLVFLSWIYLKKTKQSLPKIINKLNYVFFILVIFGNLLWYTIEIRPTHKYWNSNRAYNVQNNSIYYYHLADLHDYIEEFIQKEDIDYMKIEEILKIQEQSRSKTIEHEGIALDYNVIILQLESIHEFVINKTINGKEITPNLNKFYQENIYCINMYNQGLGSTADSEHSMANSLYPLENGRVFQKHSNNTWNSIYQNLKSEGYYTSFMHPNVNTYWNRFTIYNNGFQIDEYNDINNFYDTGERASRFFSDEPFLIQAIEKLNNYQDPYIATLVCTTGHSPFTLETINNLEEKISIDVSNMEDSIFADYLRAINFVDYCFGLFIEGLIQKDLLNNTILVVYGDHGVGMHEKEGFEQLCIENNIEYSEIDKMFENVHVPFGMYVPGLKNITIEKAISKIDIKPTLLSLLGKEDVFSIGESIFSDKDYSFIKDLGIVTKDYYYTNETIIDKENGEEISENEKVNTLIEKMDLDIYLSDTIIKYNLFHDIEFLNILQEMEKAY